MRVRGVRLLASIGVLALMAAGALLFLLGWLALRELRHAQVDDPGSLARKRETLAFMQANAATEPTQSAPRPNIVLVLFDDLGSGDLGAFGSRAVATPRIDALARDGVAFDAFYAPAPYCTPSRAGFLTGRWPIRTTLTQVVFPNGHPVDRLQRISNRPTRLPADEILLPEALKTAGYATAMVGKWHLGDESPSLPNDLGFDHFFGVLHSNDMSPLPLYRDRDPIEPDPVDQSRLTERYTDAAIAWIERQEGPFFLHFAHTFPHVPLHASAEQTGRSEAGRYGDVLADLDASVGRLVDALERTGHARDTLVFLTSDNGPWYLGRTTGLRGRKNETFEGGMRVPFVAWWPARIAPRRIAEPAAGVDLLPTALALAGVPLPRDRAIDGIDLGDALLRGAALPERPIYYYSDRALQALRLGRYKLHARHGVFGGAPWSFALAPMPPQGPWLFDLERDPDEAYDVSEKRSAEFDRLERQRIAWERSLSENPRGWR